MDKDQYIVIAGKVADGIASESELALYNAYYNKYQAKYPAWKQLSDEERKLMLDEAELLIHYQLGHKAPVKQLKLWPRIAIAAAVIGMAIGVYFYTSRHLEGSGAARDLVAVQDIAPGKNTAILTINGKQTQLSDNKTGVVINANTITYNDGSAISEAAAESLTLTTPRGGTYYAFLSDGTKIWLNADSKLELLPNFWNKAQRLVILTGEAYFEVAKNKRLPFTVRSAGQEVTVLGTHFNISAYQGEGIRTTLLEGSVKVASLSVSGGEPSLRAQRGQNKIDASSHMGEAQRGGGERILRPNQQSLITANNNITVKQVDAEETIAWKNGKFGFNSEEMGSVMRKVARWYDVEVIFKDQALLTEKVSGSVSRFANISTLLNMLEETGGTHFKIEGRKVYVTR